MTRNDFDKLKIYTLIKEHGKTIHLARSNKVFDKNSGSEEEFMLDIEVAVAKKQSNDISRKTKMGMLEKAEQGLYPSVAPIGYKNNRLTHLIEVDEERSSFIRKAFTLMASGSYSLAAIVKILNQEGFRGRKGYRVGKSAIEKILKNPIYYGAFRWQGRLRDGSHAPLFQKIFLIKHALPYTATRVLTQTAAVLHLTTSSPAEIAGARFWAKKKKKRFVYYHCTFSKGRHNGWGYVPEKEIARLFEPTVKAVTLDEEIVEWLQDALKESDKSSRRLSENRLHSLQNDWRVPRLARLYDAKFDGDSIDEEIFKIKENKYKASIAEIKAQIRTLGDGNPNFYQDACRTLELSKRLFPLFLESSYEEKASILKLLASNYSLVNASDVRILPIYRKPFDIIAEGLSRLNWLPGRDSNPRPIGYKCPDISARLGLSHHPPEADVGRCGGLLGGVLNL